MIVQVLQWLPPISKNATWQLQTQKSYNSFASENSHIFLHSESFKLPKKKLTLFGRYLTTKQQEKKVTTRKTEGIYNKNGHLQV